MSDIQRYMTLSLVPLDHGLDLAPEWKVVVTYADHVEALRQAEQRVTPVGAAADAYAQGQRDALAKVDTPQQELIEHINFAGSPRDHFDDGYRQALAGAVQRVQALNERLYGFCGQDWLIVGQVIAAIKGDTA